MKWTLKTPEYGNMIRVHAGSIYHYGIYVSDDEIIQFGLAPIARPNMKDCDVEVCVSNIDTFLCGNFLEVGEPEKKDQKKLRSPDAIVFEARSRIGEKNYNILYNNCEHFVYRCVLGEHYCSQTENVRELFKAFPIVDVYTAEIPDDIRIGNVYPSAKNKEIHSADDLSVRKSEYVSWKLLEYALDRTFGKKIKKISFEKPQGADGKWTCDTCEFSISYINGICAVVLSRKPVELMLSLEDHDSDFNDGDVDISKELSYWKKTLSADGSKYTVTVSTETPEKVRFYPSIDISKL